METVSKKAQKALRLKLDPTPEQEKMLETFFRESKAATNFALKRIYELRRGITYSKIQAQGVCRNCKGTENLNWKCQDGTLICKKCYNREYGDLAIGKKLRAGGKDKRKIPAHMRIEFIAPSLGKTVASYPPIDMAVDMYKGIDQIKKRKEYRLKRERYKLQQDQDVLENKEVEVDGKKVFARVEVPQSDGQRALRFRHVLKPNSNGYTLKRLEGFIKRRKQQIEKLEKKQYKQIPYFKGSAIRLWQGTAKIEGDKINFSLWKNKNEQIQFFGKNIKNVKGRERFKLLLSQIEKNQSRHKELNAEIKKLSKDENSTDELKQERKQVGGGTYPTLVRKEKLVMKNGKRDFIKKYFLNYPVTEHIKLKWPEQSWVFVGLDRGVNKMVVAAAIDGQTNKVIASKFIGSEDYLQKRKTDGELRKELTGKKGRNRKIKTWGNHFANFSDTLLHQRSRELLNFVKELKRPSVFVLEELTRGLAPKGTRQDKRMRKILTNFVFDKFRKRLQYKAEEDGMPLLFVPPEYTSQRCHRCGEMKETVRPAPDPLTGEVKYSWFYCHKCKKSYNADFNAAVNIAKLGLEEIKKGNVLWELDRSKSPIRLISKQLETFKSKKRSTNNAVKSSSLGQVPTSHAQVG